LKEFSEWPTFPQVYVGGELVGGLDIVSWRRECVVVGMTKLTFDYSSRRSSKTTLISWRITWSTSSAVPRPGSHSPVMYYMNATRTVDFVNDDRGLVKTFQQRIPEAF
jgi:hypothetical protein